ncbi:MAG: type II secretion system protein [Bdellovibrionales bacterium]|nr:type II secretion system protein [Bdellovibrionales bacterium]
MIPLNARGFSLIETMVAVGITSFVILFVLSLFTQTHLDSMSIMRKVDTQENLRLATWTTERAFSHAERVTWTTGALESFSFSSGGGAVRSYNFNRFSNDTSGRALLLAAFAQNTRNFANPVYTATGLFFQAPTRAQGGRLSYVNSTSGALTATDANAVVFGDIVELEVRQPRMALGNSLRSFQLRIAMRSYEQDAPMATRHFCPRADIGTSGCPGIGRYRDYERVVTILLPWNASETIPFAQFQLPLGGYFDVRQ